jgi:hypothetical protein
MSRLLELVRSLGNAGAVANARVLLDERRREDRVVQSLARRVPVPDVPAVARHAA